MRSSLVGLQLLLACVLVWGTSAVEEEKKECCGPGVPPEKSCCPKGNSTSQEPEEGEKAAAVAAEPESDNSEERKMLRDFSEEDNSKELEGRAEGYRAMIHYRRSPYESMFVRQKALDYLNKRSSGAFYRPIEDTDVEVQRATGTIVSFTQYLVNTNCTKEEGRRRRPTRWYDFDSAENVPCVAVPKDEQKKMKCRVYMFLDAQSGRSVVLRHDCDPVVFMESSDDTLDLDHLLQYSPPGFEPSF